jgi:hypothetical protein
MTKRPLPSFPFKRPTLTAPTGPFQGISDIQSAAEAENNTIRKWQES